MATETDWLYLAGTAVNLAHVTHVEPTDTGAILHFTNNRILVVSAGDAVAIEEYLAVIHGVERLDEEGLDHERT